MKNKNTKILIESAICVAIAVAIAFIPVTHLPMGPNLPYVPLAVLGIRRGFGVAVVAFPVMGLLEWMFGMAWIVTPVQFVMEYIVALMSLALLALFAKKIRTLITDNDYKLNVQASLFITLSLTVGVIAAYFWHWLAGFMYFSSDAWDGWGPWAFTTVYNGAEGLATLVGAVIIILGIAKINPKILISR
ncbi:MAG: energy-coupled thiamine transporter ThiT [Lactobacillales bacterium]|jgi:thiamine transporter|nr:energy-coupled thiamine transporter ThiT [Lactobacillales bacterium]